ncbi:uncharacterized protein [Penaeus vannamei]|uniref:uncharacterized protein n=1 Tax=Penaeus vannamei TaxID=6689 RepID=UPI00387F52B5
MAELIKMIAALMILLTRLDPIKGGSRLYQQVAPSFHPELMDAFVTSVNLSNVMYSFACAQQCNWNSCCRLACQAGPMCEMYETKVAGHWAGTDDPSAVTFDTCITKWVTNPRSSPPVMTSASSTSQGSDARKAVDGFIGRNVSLCFSSGQEPNPWWMADLGRVKRVSQVRIHTRQDGLGSEFLSVLVRLGNSSDPLAVSNDTCLHGSLDQDYPEGFAGNASDPGNSTDVGNSTDPLGNSTGLGETTVPVNSTEPGSTAGPSGSTTNPPGTTTNPPFNTTDPPGISTTQGNSLGTSTTPGISTSANQGSTTEHLGTSTEQAISTQGPTVKRRKRNIDPTQSTPTETPQSSQPEVATSTSQLGVTTTSQPGVTTTSQPGVTTTSQPGVTTTSQPGVTTSQPGVTTTSQPGVTTTSQPGVTTTSQPGVTTTSQPEVMTTSQPGITTSTSEPEVTTSTASPDLGPQCETSNETKDHVFRLNPVIGSNPGEAPLAAEVVFSLPQAVSGRYLSIQSLESDPSNVLTICNVEVLEQQREPVMRNCLDVRDKVSNRSGVYTVHPHPCCPLEVICDMDTDGGGWTVIQRRQDILPRQDFFRPWHEYVVGFGQRPCGEFWLGLENIHALTGQTPNQLRILLEDFDGATRWANYGYFHVGDEGASYALTVANYTGDAGDSLAYHNGQKFSTKDRDSDESSTNCAERFRGAWWYKSCIHSSLNGEYLGGSHNSIHEGIYWRAWRGYYYSLKAATMMIRPAA